MRIIAGEHRGRRLLGPEGEATRPITDRVKQSLFDILAPRIERAIVYDCFAGTGSMGLECLSRGAERAIFFEADRSAVARLHKNIAATREDKRSQVIAGDIFRVFVEGTPLLPQADIVFLDPPYRFLAERPDALVQLSQQLAGYLKAAGVVVFRHDAVDRIELPALERFDERTYGGMALEFLHPRSA